MAAQVFVRRVEYAKHLLAIQVPQKIVGGYLTIINLWDGQRQRFVHVPPSSVP